MPKLRPVAIQTKPRCSVEGCGRAAHTAGMCNMHHQRVLRNGDPLKSIRPPKQLGFICPACGNAPTDVTDSRPTPNGRIRRRRECQTCHARFTTFEILEDDMAIFDLRRETSAASEAMNNAVTAFNTLRRSIRRSYKEKTS